MRIALSGASNTGKTTLAKKIADKFNIPFIKSSSRHILKQYMQKGISPTQIRQSDELTRRVQTDILRHKISQENNHQCFVTDRCIFDVLVHTYYYLSFFDNNDNTQYISDYIEQCLEHVKIYDYILKLPLNCFDIVDDNLRETSVIRNTIIDALLTQFYQQYNIPILRLTCEHLLNFD